MEILKRHIHCLALLLFCTATLHSQQATADSVYNRLDRFLEEPSPQKATELADYLKKTPSTQKEVQLAKTIAYCNLGYAEAENNAFQNAINFYEEAKHLYISNNLNGYDIIEYCLKPLGNLYTKSQALSEAENTIKHYIVLAQETDRPEQEVSGILNLSVIYHNRGVFQNAIALLKQGLQKAPNNTDLKLNLASNYFGLGQHDKAKALLRDVLATTSDNANAEQLLARVYLSEKKYGQAITSLKRALEITEFQKKGTSRNLAKLYLALAETYLENQETQEAAAALQKAYRLLIPSYTEGQTIPKASQLYAETTLLDALDLQAELFQDTNDIDKAITALERAFKVNDYIFAQLYSQDSKLIVQQNVKQRAELLMYLLYEKYRQTQDAHWLERAIQLDTRAKGRVVTDAHFLKKQLYEKANGSTAQFEKLQRELAFLRDRIQKNTQSTTVDYKQLVSLQKQFSRTLTRQRMLYDSITAILPEKQEKFELEQLRQKATRSKQSIVSYFMGKKTVYQFIISAESTTFERLTDSEEAYGKFVQTIQNYNHFFNDPETINNDIPAFASVSNSLYRQLQLPKAENLVIIPDGILTFVPFQTLLTQTSEAIQYKKMPFLVFESNVSYSISFHAYLKNTAPFSEKQSVLGVFPVFKNTPRELGYSVFEAEAIEAVFPAKMLMDKQATANAFLENADSYTILHISTHALGGTFSSEPSIQFSDRTLSLEELYGLQFSNQLIVLSACDTGVGKVIKGEGALSLARGFQYAGAPNVLFSLWQVNDKSTAQLMAYYYKNLKENWSRNRALHRASLDYLEDETIDNSRKSPYYWGAFVYYGTTDMPLEHSDIKGYIIGVLAFLVLVVAVWLARKRRLSS